MLLNFYSLFIPCRFHCISISFHGFILSNQLTSLPQFSSLTCMRLHFISLHMHLISFLFFLSSFAFVSLFDFLVTIHLSIFSSLSFHLFPTYFIFISSLAHSWFDSSFCSSHSCKMEHAFIHDNDSNLENEIKKDE